MEDCGTSLQCAIKQKLLSLAQMVSICYQLILGLTVAEMLYEYEHRDLHLNNVMLRRTSSLHVNFVIASRHHSVITHGIRAFIIDNTFARARIGAEHYFTNLSNKLYKLASQYVDHSIRSQLTDQNKVYVRMFRTARHNWAKWVPETNLYWLRHIVCFMLQQARNDKTASSVNSIRGGHFKELVKLDILLHKATTMQSLMQYLQTARKKNINA